MADINTSVADRTKVSEQLPVVDFGSWAQASTAYSNKGLAAVENRTKGLPAGFNQDFHISGLDLSVPESGKSKAASTSAKADANAVGKTAGNKFDATAVATELHQALNPKLLSLQFGADSDKAFNTLKNVTPEQYKAVDKAYSELVGPAGSGSLEKGSSLEKKAASVDARLGQLIESKKHNDVPEEQRVTGEQLLKAGSNLKVGEINAVTLADGRRYDVYVPKNADKRAPVIVAMHGASAGDSIGLMAQESGLTADAERTGAIVVFAYSKPRQFDIGVTNVTGVAWNAPGRINLPAAVDNVTDDRKYLDNVLDDLATKSKTAEKVGLFGFSDGGRFAQIYAADRPDRVAAFVSMEGTWMQGEKAPAIAKPAMIVHGDSDKTLPYEGGMGSVSRKMDWLLGTNLEKSAPYMQAEVWKKANQCDGPVEVKTQGDVTERNYTGCKVGEVKEYIVKGGEHGLHDYKNDGSRMVQWMLGRADRRQASSTEGAKFLTKHIVSDLSSK